MADNVTVLDSTGATKTIAMDDIAGVHHQRAKIMIGADGAATDVSTANPLPVSDAGGSLTVDGTVAATQSGTWTVQPGNTANTTAWKVDGSAVTQPVSGTVSVTGVATEATLDARTGSLTETAPATDTASSGINGRLQRIAQRLTSLIGLFPTALGQTTKANSFAVTLASDQDALPITDNSGSITVDNAGTFAVQAAQKVATAAALSNVAGSATSVTLLASNASRRKATFYNDSTAILYLKFGATASTTSFTAKLFPEAFFEMPDPCYTGVVDGIWASATGSCRATELT